MIRPAARAARARPFDPRLLRYGRSSRPYLAVCMLLGLPGAAAVLAQAALLADMITAVFSPGRGSGRGRLRSSHCSSGSSSCARCWPMPRRRRRPGGGHGEIAAAHRAAAPGGRARTGLAGRVEQGGELAQLATRGIDAVDAYFARYLPQLVLTCLVPPTFVIVIWVTDWLSGLIVLVTLPVVVMFLVLIGQATERQSRRQWRSLERLSHHFLDVVDGLTTLRVFGRAALQRRSIAAVTDSYRRTTMSVLRVSFLSSFVLELAASLSVALVAVQLGLRLLGGDIGLGAAPADTAAGPRRLPAAAPARRGPPRGRGGAGRHLRRTRRPRSPLAAGRSTIGSAGGPARAASCGTCVIGRAGRSRLGAGLARRGPRRAGRPDRSEREPASRRCWPCCSASSGPTRDRSGWARWTWPRRTPSVWRAQIAWVPQSRGVAARLGGRERRARGERRNRRRGARALELAAADDIDPERMLGEGGAGLSAGERQRVALARAYLRAERGAGLLLLDEPTAHLDGPTRDRVLDGLRRIVAGRCVLLVVHDRRWPPPPTASCGSNPHPTPA